MKALPTLKQLSYLVALAEEGHFSRAAERSFVTQSTVSAGIKELEETLGAKLVERTKRSVMLTTLGEEIANRARGILRQAEDMSELAASRREPLTGELRLGVIPTVGPYLLPQIVPGLRTAYPELKLYLREETTRRLLDLLGKGQLDVVLMALPYEIKGAESLFIADDPFFAALPASHPLTARESLKPDDLDPDSLLLLEDGHCLRDHALSACRLEQSSIRRGFEATSLHTLVQMVNFGLGVTLLPRVAIESGVLSGTNIEVRPLEGRDVSRRIGLVWRKTSGRAKEFQLLAKGLIAARKSAVTGSLAACGREVASKAVQAP